MFESTTSRAWRVGGGTAPTAPSNGGGEITLRSRTGREILASTVAQRHREFMSIVARDISEEQATARQLEELVVAKDEFIASVSHELRTTFRAVSLSSESGMTKIAVADKGPGIDPDMIERIFQPYESAHTSVTQPNSVGLGLSVSRWLAEKMGGSLMYENESMSTFVLRLPE